MKKEKNITINNVTFRCISCNSEYITRGVFEKKDWVEKINSCGNCCPFYTKTFAGEVRIGAVEKFRERAEKTKKIQKKTEKENN